MSGKGVLDWDLMLKDNEKLEKDIIIYFYYFCQKQCDFFKTLSLFLVNINLNNMILNLIKLNKEVFLIVGIGSPI